MKKDLMKNIKHAIICLLALIYSQMAFSGTPTKEYDLQFKQAMNYIQNDDYKSAMPVISAMLQVNTNNSNLEFYAGLCNFYLVFDKNIALHHFNKAAQNISTTYKNTASSIQAPNETVYFQALCYHYLGQNENAIKKYDEYIKNSKAYSSDRLVLNDAKKKKNIAKENPMLFTSAENQNITDLRVNTKKIDNVFKNKLAKVMDIINDDKIEAILQIKEMLKEYPNEPNLNYLMGICMLNIKPLNNFATNYFTVADKNSSSFKDCSIGLDCPSFVKYYSGIANQIIGNHKQALADFEAFNAVYPNDYTVFKPEFIQRMEYSKSMIPKDTTNTIVVNNIQTPAVDTTALKVLFPILGTPVEIEIVDNSKNSQNSDLDHYYSVQVGAGNMRNDYFNKVNDLRISTYKKGMKRYLSGKYKTKTEAILRQKELISLGYTDAFITRMRKK